LFSRPLSTQVWAALGTAIVSTAGILLFGERCDARKFVCLLMIVGGVVGLELSDRHS
jgi:multidrug transporter EmrE-like cation transporter